MGFSYLDNRFWRHITRDERFFCAELYFKIKGQEKEFIKWLKEKTEVNFLSDDDLNQHWEIGYEVCFYRDYIKVIGEKNGNKQIKKSAGLFPAKRTFDLCLFSEEKMIIIEAKAQQGFYSGQNNEFEKDKKFIEDLIGDSCKTYFVALVSSAYYENLKKHSRMGELPKLFDGYFFWKNVAEYFDKDDNDSIFIKADEGYKK